MLLLLLGMLEAFRVIWTRLSICDRNDLRRIDHELDQMLERIY